MASFFYADIKTDELQVHGHNPSIPAQIELFDANASNMVIIRAPISLTQPNVIITLPSNVATANSLMMNTLGNGELSFISPGGDISMDMNGSFTVNSLSNTSTVTSYSNLTMSVDKRLQFRDSNNYISSNVTGDMLINSDYGNIFITATGEVVILSKSNGTVKIINEGVNELGFIVEQPNTYINFGGTTGSAGYGIRDNDGVLQIKNRIDAPVPIYEWSNIVARLDNLQDCNISGVSNNQVLVYSSEQSRWVNSNSVGQLGYYGSFYDTTTQLSAGTSSANPIKLNTTAEAYGVSILGTSNIKVDHSGVYNVQFSAQLENLSSGRHPVDIWLTKNGINESNTNTKVTLVGNNSKEVAAWNFVLSLNANDYVTIYWACTNSTNVQLTAEAASSSPTRPAVPSVIATITQITNIQDGTLRLGDLLNVNDTSKTSNSLIQYNSAQNQWQSVSNITLDTGNMLKFGSTANISAPVTGNLTLQGSNIDLIVANGNDVHVHNNLRVTGTLFMDGSSTSNISAPTASNLDLKAGNVNIIATSKIVNQVAGKTIYTANYVGSNSIINMGSTSGESGIGFKNTSGGQIQVKPNSSASWTNLATHLSNLGDVTIAMPANTNALLYNSGTNRWTNRLITYGDISGLATRIAFTSYKINIGSNTGLTSQGANAVAVGTNAGFTGQGSNSIAIGTNAGYSNLPSNAVVISGIGSVWDTPASTAGLYIAPVRNVNASNVVMYNPSTYEMTYGSRDYYTLTMWGDLNNTYAASTGTLKFLFSLNATYWDTAPNSSASPPSLIQFSSGAITYNTSNGIIELNATKNYYMNLDVQIAVNYGTNSTIVMELVKNPVTSNTILCTSKLEAAASPDYVYYTLPIKTIITTASNIRINVYKATVSDTAVNLTPGCQITMFLQEI
jgi:hypothetical protein